ncbi:MAG: hypothetical protein HY735_27030 [Verrucomicrobia bacterium]|nr:hypothetical protein [Verrucomicrobiota bacterium]
MMPSVEKYLAAGGGILPPDLFQLKPYFESPVTDEMLQRYQRFKGWAMPRGV